MPAVIGRTLSAFQPSAEEEVTLKLLIVCFVICVVAEISGFPQSLTRKEDCNPYDPATLVIADVGIDGWILQAKVKSDKMMTMANLDNKDDAEAALALAKRHSAVCYIGRDNKRGRERIHYIVQYWK